MNDNNPLARLAASGRRRTENARIMGHYMEALAQAPVVLSRARDALMESLDPAERDGVAMLWQQLEEDFAGYLPDGRSMDDEDWRAFLAVDVAIKLDNLTRNSLGISLPALLIKTSVI